MLVLTRKQGESIQIGSDITITIVDLGKGRVKIGVAAPVEVPIRRSELEPEQVVQPASVTPAASNLVDWPMLCSS